MSIHIEKESKRFCPVAGYMSASELAQSHWNETPLFLSADERYQEYPWLPEAAEFSKHRGHRVLELGCGTGCDLLQFANYGAKATGVDITTSHVALAKQRVAGKAAVIRADIRYLPFADSCFDYVYSHGVIHHSNEPGKIANEIMRVLRPTGRFNVHVYALYSYFALYQVLRHRRNWRVHVENSEAEVHIDLYTSSALRALFPVPLSIEKHQCKPFEKLAPLFGWYLVAKGSKP